jgi:hypothetical protein
LCTFSREAIAEYPGNQSGPDAIEGREEMSKACGATVAICLLFSPLARAGPGEDVALDKLPQGVLDALKRDFPGAELLVVAPHY